LVRGVFPAENLYVVSGGGQSDITLIRFIDKNRIAVIIGQFDLGAMRRGHAFCNPARQRLDNSFRLFGKGPGRAPQNRLIRNDIIGITGMKVGNRDDDGL